MKHLATFGSTNPPADGSLCPCHWTCHLTCLCLGKNSSAFQIEEYSRLAQKPVSQTYGKYQRCACRSQNGRHDQLCKELLARESGVTKDYRLCRPIPSEFVSVEESCTQITANSFKCDGRCYQILHGIPYIDIYIVYLRYSFVSDSSPSQTYKQYTSCTDTISNPTVK